MAFFQTRDNRLKGLLAAQSLVLCLHFVFLELAIAAIVALVTAIRNLMSMTTSSRRLAPSFIFIYLCAGWVGFTHWLGLLPIVAACLSTYALFNHRGLKLRVFLMCSTFLWLTHNIAFGSIGPSVMELVMLCANGTAMARLRNQRRLRSVSG